MFTAFRALSRTGFFTFHRRGEPLLQCGDFPVDRCIEERYSRRVIKSFRHTGLERLFKDGSKAGETHSAWRMRVSGGWKQATYDVKTGRRGGFRVLDAESIALLGDRLPPPSILGLSDAIRLAGLRQLSSEPEDRASQLAGAVSHPSLPSSASPSN